MGELFFKEESFKNKEEHFKEDTQKEINDCVQPFYNFPYNVGNIYRLKDEDFLHREERIKLWNNKKDKFKGYKEKIKSKKLTEKEKEYREKNGNHFEELKELYKKAVQNPNVEQKISY